jgi:hypothetical protein
LSKIVSVKLTLAAEFCQESTVDYAIDKLQFLLTMAFVFQTGGHVIIHDRFHEHRRWQRLGHIGLVGYTCVEQLAPPSVDQPGRDVMAAADIGNPSSQRKCLGHNLQPLLIGPSPAPLRPRKDHHLTRQPLQSALLRALATYPREAAPAG